MRDGDVWKVIGSKTWITHAARADLMTLLVRTKPDEKDYRGLSMLLAKRTRGTDDDPFPDQGINLGEIEVFGYQEYTLSFDGFEVAMENLLGNVEGQGFKQLTATFGGARIQNAARIVDVAQAALECGLRYAKDRKQFGQPMFAFPRAHGQVAWSAADNALHIHGGDCYALQYEISRILCDARTLNIFEGAAGIQAQVIARRLLD